MLLSRILGLSGGIICLLFVEIHGARAQGSLETVALTHTKTEKSDLTFLDRDTLVFTEQFTPRQLALMKLTLSTGQIERFHPKANNNEFEVTFSPDGVHYAFVQNVGNLNLKLIIRNRETGTDAEFQQGGFSGMRCPTFTPDGKRLLYSYPEDGRQPIWSCDLQCKDRKALIDSSGINNWPAVTPDGKNLVFGSSRDGNFEIYIAHEDGKEVRRLTDNRFQDIRPCVSPDGKHIAWVSNRDGNYELYRMRLDGTETTRLTKNPERDDFPAWHPDGRLAYVAEQTGSFDVRMMTMSGE